MDNILAEKNCDIRLIHIKKIVTLSKRSIKLD